MKVYILIVLMLGVRPTSAVDGFSQVFYTQTGCEKAKTGINAINQRPLYYDVSPTVFAFCFEDVKEDSNE